MAALLGVLVAASFGSGDFLGGLSSRRAPTLTVLLVAQIAAVAGALVICPFVHASVSPHDIGFGLLAGCVNIVGIGLLYQGLAVGRMGVVAPLCSIVAACVPVTWGIANGERPSVTVIVGAVIAVGAAGLISRPQSEPQEGMPNASGVPWAVGAGLCLGTSLILYVQTSTGSGLWPVLAARAAALVLVVVVLIVFAARRAAVALPAGLERREAVGAGFLDVAASTFLLLAVRRDLLVVVTPLAALAPAATVLLARVVEGERLHLVQRVGLVLALIGLVMIVTA